MTLLLLPRARGRALQALLAAAALACIASAASCDRSAKLGPPSIATGLRLAKNDLELPQAKKVDAEPVTPVAHVVVSRTGITLLGDPWPIAKLPDDAALGVAADDKRDGRSSFAIPALAHALEWQRNNDKTGPDGILDVREVVIVADAKTTYRVTCEVVASIATISTSGIALAARTGDRARPVGIIPITQSHTSGHRVRRDPLTVRLGDTGAVISMDKRTIATGCKDVGPGPAVPREPQRPFDFGALETCMKEMKKSAPDLEREIILVAAGPATDLATVIELIEAVRGGGFEDVGLAAPNSGTP